MPPPHPSALDSIIHPSTPSSSMASRTSEASYWDSQQSPQSQYPLQQHYYSSSPSMVNQQQPRQAPLLHSLTGSDSSSPYSPSPSSNVYYGSFYQSTPMNGVGVGNGTASHNNVAGTYAGLASSSVHHQSQANSNSGGSQTGLSSSYMTSDPNSLPLASSQTGGGHYSLGNSQHLHSNGGMYHRSQMAELSSSSGGGGGSLAPVLDDLSHHYHHRGSQHSGSPTMDGSEYSQGMKAKRRQVKNACINCQKACKRCDEGRPCTRCVKYGLTETCQDSSRKERKRGIKRGPYKRRATTNSQPTSSTTHYPQSTTFMVMDGLHNAPFLSHSTSHNSIGPQLRNSREESGQVGVGEGSSGMESNLLNSPSYPSSAPGTSQRTSNLMGSNHDGTNGFYAREHFHPMQPPRYTSRYEYERNGTMTSSPALASYNTRQVNPPPPPVSAPASSTNFSSSPASGYSSRSLFSPPALLSTGFLNPSGHHRLHSDSSLGTSGTNAGASLSPRTPMSLSTNPSQGMMAEVGQMGTQPASTNSSPGAFTSKSTNGISSNSGYLHHPLSTTTTSLPTTTAGAFSNSPTSSLHNVQPFPLHIPHSARWRGAGTGSDQGLGLRNRSDEREEQLAPMKMHGSADSDMSAGTLSNRQHLSSPRSVDELRIDRSGVSKVEQGENIMA